MCEQADLLQGIRLGDHIKRVCAKCKLKVDPATVVCPKCQKALPAPVVLPSFREEIESALRFALAGQLGINARGEIDEAVKDVKSLARYLAWAADVVALETTITYGYPRLLAECDRQGSLFPDLKTLLPAARAFLREQQDLATKALARLRQDPVMNNLEQLMEEYKEGYELYAAGLEKTGGKPAATLDAIGNQLAGILTKVDLLVQLIGPQGPLWALQSVSALNTNPTQAQTEWGAILFVVNNLANFPINEQLLEKTGE